MALHVMADSVFKMYFRHFEGILIVFESMGHNC